MLHALDDLLKALNSAKELWREADFVTKQLDEMALAKSDVIRHRRAGEQSWVVLKLLDRERDSRMVLERTTGNAQQPLFNHPELHIDRSSFVKTTDQLACFLFAPQISR